MGNVKSHALQHGWKDQMYETSDVRKAESDRTRVTVRTVS
jgi:hypothetical protein